MLSYCLPVFTCFVSVRPTFFGDTPSWLALTSLAVVFLFCFSFLACPYLFGDFVLFCGFLFPWLFLFIVFVQAARCTAVAPQITTSLLFITACPLVPLASRVRWSVIPLRVRRAWCHCDVLAFATYILTPFCYCSFSHFCYCSFCRCFFFVLNLGLGAPGALRRCYLFMLSRL